jgi:hypothetical protein
MIEEEGPVLPTAGTHRSGRCPGLSCANGQLVAVDLQSIFSKVYDFFKFVMTMTLNAQSQPFSRNPCQWCLIVSAFGWQSILNKAFDFFFKFVMTMTLNEDKTILESLYKDHQRGYVLSRYDKPLKLYRRTIKEFQVRTASIGCMQNQVI